VTWAPIGLRVLRRWARGPGAEEFSFEALGAIVEGGLINASDVQALARLQVGHVEQLAFAEGSRLVPNGLAWKAIDANGSIVEGALILHAAAARDRVEMWGEVQVNSVGGRNLKIAKKDPREVRLEAISERGRALIEEARDRLTMKWIEMVAGVVRIVEIAEGYEDE
jgi:hypothetical protein